MSSGFKKTMAVFRLSTGLLLGFAMLLAVNVISSFVYFRFDLTEGSLYTLSPGTEKILSRLENPVVIRFYFSRSNSEMPVSLRNYASRVGDLLEEYVQASGGKVKLEKYDPVPDSEARESAEIDGITGQPLSSGGRMYLGMAVSSLDRTDSLTFLNPAREAVLEYEISRAIASVASGEEVTVGVMSAFPVMGGPVDGGLKTDSGKAAEDRPWIAFSELARDFKIRKIPLDATHIDKDIKVLVIVQPSGISARTMYAVDQYLLRGGKLAVFLDPYSLYASIRAKKDNSYLNKLSSDMPFLVKAWGVKYNPAILAADMKYALRATLDDRMVTRPTILQVRSSGLNSSDLITAQLEKLSLCFAGVFLHDKETAAPEINPLVRTTTDSRLVSAFLVDKPEVILKHFTPSGKRYDLSVYLGGVFKTAFPGGPPAAGNDSGDGGHLEKSLKPGAVVLAGDTDFLVNDMCVKIVRPPGRSPFYIRKNDNINFFQNIVEFLAGDETLIDIRCRRVMDRPFSVVSAIRSRAEQNYKNRILELERDLRAAQDRLNNLERKKRDQKEFILSPAQRRELADFKKKSAGVRKELKDVKKQFRKDIDSLENTLKLINIALVPFLVIVTGIIVAVIRKRRHSAR